MKRYLASFLEHQSLLSLMIDQLKEIPLLRGNRGTALILTLMIIITLAGLTIGFSEETDIELNLAAFSRDGYRALQLAKAGAHTALALLSEDENLQMDSLKEDWAKFGPESIPEVPQEEASLTARLSDETGKLNINRLFNTAGNPDVDRIDQLSRLFNILGLEEKYMVPILDWLDHDDIARMDGAENSYYQGLDEPYSCRNGPFITIGRIFLVKGLNEKADLKSGKRLSDFVTIYSNGKVNINTAPVEVLQCLSEKIDATATDAIVEYRKENDFLQIADIKNVTGIDEGIFNSIKSWITVKSSFFSIEVEGIYQEAAGGIKAVAIRENKKAKIVYWQVY